MKKYGTAEYILTLIQQYVDTRAESLTEEEKEKFHACAESIRKNMDTADHLA